MKSLSLSTPHIIATVGVPGSGKTHFAEQFAETFSAPLISHHRLQDIAADESMINAIMPKLLKEVMKTKQTIVFEGATDRRVERMELAKLARENGYKILFVWVQADQNTSKQRALRQMSLENYERLLARFSSPHKTEQYVVISGRHTYGTQAKTILKRLTESRTQAVESTQNRPTPERRPAGRISIN